LRFVIFGLAKTGTTALFYKIRSSLPPASICLFEPSTFGPMERLAERLRAARRGALAPDVLAKVLPWGPKAVRVADFERFERQVLIVRDPRDRMISDLLYRGFNAALARHAPAALEMLALLRRKEAEPQAVPLVRLLAAYDRLEAGLGAPSDWRQRYGRDGVERPLAFHALRPRLASYRYDDLVAGRFGALEAAIGHPLSGAAEVPPVLGRVVRTKGSGAWRSWFTPEDVAQLRPLLQPYLDRYYPRADWDLSPSPVLDPGEGSLYAARVIAERRALAGLPPLPPTP